MFYSTQLSFQFLLCRDASKNFDKSLHQIVSRLASTEIKLKSALDLQKSLKIQELQLEGESDKI